MLVVQLNYRYALTACACLAFAAYLLVPEAIWERTSVAFLGEPLPPLQALAVKRANSKGEIILFYANSGFVGQLVNAVCSLRAQGNEHFVIATVDDSMEAICKDLHLPCAPSVLGHQEDIEAMEFQSPGYYNIVQTKTAQVEALLQQGLHVFFSDSDVYYLQDPLQQDLPCRDDSCHIAMSTNRPDVPPAWEYGNWNMNSGLYYVRSSELMIAEWSAIREAVRLSGELEQPPFNAVLCGLYGEYKDFDQDLCVNPNQVRTAMLDPARFVISASDRLSPEKVEPIWHWHTLPRDLVTIHLAWLSGEAPKMSTWKHAGMISFNQTDFTCLPFMKEARAQGSMRRIGSRD